MPWKLFSDIYEPHISINLKKTTCKKLWGLEPELFDKTCSCKFRENDNVSPWLFRMWQIVSGEFYPRNLHLGKMFLKEIDQEICDWIVNQKSQIVCVNDAPPNGNGKYTFEEQKKMLKDSFDCILYNKSSFEL